MGILRSILPMKKIGKITVVCFVVLALFLQGKPVAFASTSTWTAQTSRSDLPINSVAYGVDSNGHGLWVTGESNGKIDTSPDGVTWTFSTSQIDPPFNDYFSSAVFGSEWVLVGQIGEIVTSPVGSTWTKRNTPANTPDLLGVAYGGGTYVAVGQSGTILTSTDGANWTSHNAGTNEFWGVAYGGGHFVAVGDSGTIYTSLDGIAWIARASGTSSSLDCVTFGGGLFVAAGDNGTIRTSPDGVTWTSRASGTPNNLYGVAYGSGKFVAVGDGNTIVSSLDGTTWEPEQPASEPSSAYFDCVAYGGSKFVAGGGDGGETNYPGIIQTQVYSNNADLSGLALSSGTLSPAFTSSTTSYTASVPNSVTSVNVMPSLADGTATFKVNGMAAGSGNALNVPLTVGSNTITVVVTAQNGITQKTYTVSVTRAAANSNADLSSLTLDHGTLSPTFTSGTTSYTASVANSVASLNVTPMVADNTATLKVNGMAATSGSAVPVPLIVGSNTITVVVTAQDGTTQKSYIVTVTRAAPSTNADLSNLTLDHGTLSPTFDSGTLTYSASVANSVTSVNVTPTVADNTATLKIDGTTAISGSAVTVPLTVGSNTITVLATAQDGTTQKPYTITVTRAASSNANLSSLTLDQGTLSPTFDSGTLTYSAGVVNSVTSVNVTPTVADSTATLKIDGTTATSGSAVNVPLTAGSNTITVVVTAQDGTAQTYTITVTRAQSSNANLSSLTLDQGTLSPAFASSTLTYTDSVANSVTSVNVTPTVADSTATFTVNGTTPTSGNTVNVPLNVGSNTITVVVTAQDGSTQTYTITVTRAQSSNANLSSLTLDQGTLSPAFASGTTSYTASVANSVSSVNVTPTVADSTATFTVNGTTPTSGSTVNVPLNVGSNTITVVVTAQDGSTQTYTITVTRAASSNANLSSLTLDQGTLSPAFASSTGTYTASVANSVSSVNVTPTVADSTATFTVNGSAATSGSAVNIPLNVGNNTITVVVTAQDGTAQTYTITVTRAQSSNANLSSLTLDQGTLSPAFASGTLTYTASVANSVSSVNVTPTVADSTATFTVNGSAATSGSAVNVPLNVGSNIITVVVTAQDGTAQTYTITVTRAQSSNANLSSLTLDQGTLSPAFASGTLTYTASVANSVSSVNVTPTVADSTATFTVNGSAATSGSAVNVPLNVGSNTITVVVTAQDGSTQKTYTVMVTRAASSNADLSNLTLSQGTLSPTFASGTTSYTASVASSVTRVNVTPTVADTTATLTVNGSAATSGSAVNVPLHVGSNTITVVVTAQDRINQTYTITVTRATAPGGGNPAPGLPFVIASQTVDNTGAIIQKTNGNTSITVNVPAGAFSTPEQLTVSAGVIGDLSHILTGLPSKSVRIVLGVNFDGAPPTVPITVTIMNPSITKNTVLYKVGADGHLVTVKATISDGEATLSFTSDPDFITVNLTSGERVITSAGTAAIVPSFVHKDAGIDTTYMPIWYVMQILKGMGIESTWDGHNWNITTSHPIDASRHITTGMGTTHVYVNGSLIQDVTMLSVVDPSTNKPTTYMPIWYVMQILSHLGLDSTWDGITWTLTE